jgi:hypothetical protein
MNTLPLASPIVNPDVAPNPRDSWPAWTGEDRWELCPDEPAEDRDEARPTHGPDFLPSAEDLAGSVALLNADVADYWPDSWPDFMEVSTVSDRDYQAGQAELIERARERDADDRN